MFQIGSYPWLLSDNSLELGTLTTQRILVVPPLACGTSTMDQTCGTLLDVNGTSFERYLTTPMKKKKKKKVQARGKHRSPSKVHGQTSS